MAAQVDRLHSRPITGLDPTLNVGVDVAGQLGIRRESPSDYCSLDVVRNGLKVVGFDFRFLDHFKRLAFRYFAGDQVLRVLESECGEGYTLGSLKRLDRSIGKAVHTTGITSGPHNVRMASRNVDYLIVGTLPDAFAEGKLDGGVHFILDWNGVVEIDSAVGEKVASVYGEILRPGGTALMRIAMASSSKGKEEEIESFLKAKGLEVLQMARGVALVEKPVSK